MAIREKSVEQKKRETYRSPGASQCNIPNGFSGQHSSNLDVLHNTRFMGVPGKEYSMFRVHPIPIEQETYIHDDDKTEKQEKPA